MENLAGSVTMLSSRLHTFMNVASALSFTVPSGFDSPGIFSEPRIGLINTPINVPAIRSNVSTCIDVTESGCGKLCARFIDLSGVFIHVSTKNLRFYA
jgi:hypothetical protein